MIRNDQLIFWQDDPSDWSRFGNHLVMALRELIDALRLQEVALAATHQPLALSTPFQIIKVRQIPYRGRHLSVYKYFMAYLRSLNDLDVKRTYQRRIKQLPNPPADMSSWSLERTMAEFTRRAPLVQLRSLTITDIRCKILFDDSSKEGLDLLYDELYTAYGLGYTPPSWPKELSNQFVQNREKYARAAYKTHREQVQQILHQAAHNLGRTVGIAIGIGAHLSESLQERNLVGFSWPKDFDNEEVPERNHSEFNPDIAEKGVVSGIDRSEWALRALAYFLTGSFSTAEVAIQRFHRTVGETFRQVQDRVINDRDQNIFHPDYVRAYRIWRDTHLLRNPQLYGQFFDQFHAGMGKEYGGINAAL